MMTRKKGAVFTFDLIVSTCFFMVIILSMLWVWSSTARQMSEYSEVDAKYKRVLDITQILVTDRGNPSNWYESAIVSEDGVYALGLVSSPNILDGKRIDNFLAIEYEVLKKILGLGGEEFRLTIIRDIHDSRQLLYEKGAVQNFEERISIKRYALFEGEPVELKMTIYFDKK